MLDIKLIRENPEEVKKGIARKGADPKLIDELIMIDRNRRRLQGDLERAQKELNTVSKDIAKLHGQQKIDAINNASVYSDRVRKIKPELEHADKEYFELAYRIPNLPEEDVIDGKSDKDNTVNRKHGEPTKFDFKPLDHVDLGSKLDLIDIERAVKIAGSRSYFLKNELVILEFALVQYVLGLLVKEGFIAMVPPVLLNRKAMEGAGYLPDGEDEIYKTQDDTYLAGTSEQPLAGYHQGEILDVKQLPVRYAGFSSCFRREAGSYGKDVRGILRVHQFDKVEMFSYTKPADSKKEQDYLVSLEEKIMQSLKIPYQIVNICAGDLGAPATKKFDLEAWMPGENKYRETHSCSNCTDFQARRLNIRFRDEKGKVENLHTLNGTAVAIGRTLIAILENYQQKDGSIKIPEVLRPFTGFDSIKVKE